MTECVFHFLATLVISTESEFAYITAKGCHFHITKSIWREVQELGLMAVYNHIPQIRNTIKSWCRWGFFSLLLVRMCLGNLKRASAPLHVQARALADLFLCSGITASTVRFNTDFYTFSISIETFWIWLSSDRKRQRKKVTKK